MSARRVVFLAAVAAGLSGLSGCSWFGGGRGEALDADRRFAPAPVAPVRNTPQGVDEPGFIRQPESTPKPLQDSTSPPSSHAAPADLAPVRPPLTQTTPPLPATPPSPDAAADEAPLVVEPQTTPPSLTPPPTTTATPTADTTPPSSPATRAAAGPGGVGRSTGAYMTLGGVVAEVNNRPIYANQVLREIVGPLRARARELDEAQFREAATRLIDDQIKRLSNAEREVAVAERNLDEKDKDIARLMAARWRAVQITQAGGSVELAKRRWAAEGYDLEERVDEEYRRFLAQMYYNKKVWPRVQVTAEETRQYYDQHLADEFTVRDEVRFRLIKVDVRRTGGREQALAKVTDLRARAVRGEDFAAIASGTNDDKFLMSRGGDVGWVQKGSYANAAVEKAVWDLQPGQVTDIVDAGTAFYVGKLEERKLGRVMPFDEQAVQQRIRKTIGDKQFREMRDRVFESLGKNSVVRSDRDMVNAAIDMAVQNYPRWHGAE